MSDPDLDSLTQRFLGAFQLVFQDDWSYSRYLLESDMPYVVGTGTFIEPSTNFATDNWGARRALLQAHGELIRELAKQGKAPVVPSRDAHFNYSWSEGEQVRD